MAVQACRRRLAAVLAIAVTVLVGGCDRQPSTAAVVPAETRPGVVAAPRADAAPVAVAAPRPANSLDGVWRVTGVAVAADAPSMFANDDASIMGSEITVSDKTLSWTRKASADFTADDVCNGPRAEPLAPGVASDAAPSEFAAAIARFGKGEPPGGVLRWACTTGGTWGPEADDGARMLRLGENRLAMGWYDGVVLLLERAVPAR